MKIKVKKPKNLTRYKFRRDLVFLRHYFRNNLPTNEDGSRTYLAIRFRDDS